MSYKLGGISELLGSDVHVSDRVVRYRVMRST